MAADRINNDLVISGDLQILGRFVPPAGCITNAAIPAGANIDNAKLIHQFPVNYQQAPGANIAAATQDLLIVRGVTGTLIDIHAALTGVIPSGDRTAVVDIQKSTGAGAFATVLTSPITLSTSNVLRTAVAGVLASTALVVGDILRVIITLGGASGTNPQGLIVTLVVAELPN